MMLLSENDSTDYASDLITEYLCDCGVSLFGEFNYTGIHIVPTDEFHPLNGRQSRLGGRTEASITYTLTGLSVWSKLYTSTWGRTENTWTSSLNLPEDKWDTVSEA